MDIELFLVELLVSIKNGSSINHNLLSTNRNLFNDSSQFYELLNIVLTAYKYRFVKTYSDEQRIDVIKALSRDISAISDLYQHHNCDPRLIVANFEFVLADRYYSDEFRTKTRNLVDVATKSSNSAIQLIVATRIMSTIIRCRLYGNEGFDSILEECAALSRSILDQQPSVPKFSLME